MSKSVLKDKQYKSYNYLSRYSSFPYYYHSLDRKYIYGTTSQLVSSIPYVLYISKFGDTWDSIALDFYNNPSLYWVICDFNHVQDPYSPIKEKENIKIPVLNSIVFEEN